MASRAPSTSSSLIARIARMGIDAHLSQESQRQIAITNLFALTTALTTLPWVFAFAFFGHVELGVGVLFVSALVAGSIAWNARQRFVTARLWLLAWSNAAIFAFAVALGSDSGIAMLFTATTCAPLALFDPKDHRGPFVVGVVTPVALGAAAQRIAARHAPPVALSPTVLGYLFPALLVTTVLLLLFIVTYYYYVYERNRAARERQHRVEQARLDTALRESEQRYALASEGANDGLWEWSASTGEVFYSERWKSMLGYGPDEIGTSFVEWLDRVHPDDRARVQAEIDAHMDGRSERLRVEHRVRTKAGAYAWMLTRGLAIRDPRGRAVRMAGWMTDVTERRLTIERLAESEEIARQLVAQAADALYFFDLEGRIRDVNHRAVVDTGYSRDELLSMNVCDLDRGLTREKIASLAERIPPGDSLTFERVHTTKSGRAIAVELRLAFFRHRDERHLLASARDVSVRKEMEAQLMLADRMASVGTLAAGVAHEINNPLTSLLLNLEFIERQMLELPGGPDDPYRDRMLRALLRAREGAERVGFIVRDLKTFSRGEVESRDAVDLRRVVESTLSLAHPELKRRASVHTDMPFDLPAVRANEARLGQVFLNLLLNALQAFAEENTRENRITIRVREDGAFVMAEVVDNGAGIADNLKTRIFDPFFTTKPVGVGTGLGLYICRNIVESLGGQITCESELGRGTTFRMRLPTVRSLADGTSRFTPVSAGSSTRASVPPPPTPRPLEVLVVDDDATVGVTLTEVLSGHVVTVVDSADRASDALGMRRFDVVLCDFDLHERARERLSPRASDDGPRWAYMVSPPVEPNVSRLVALGAVVIEKPVRSETLWELIAEKGPTDAARGVLS